MIYKPPADAKLILPLKFKVHDCCKGVYHAEATLEIETWRGFEYYTVCYSAKTYRAALRGLISKIETSQWFQYFKSQGVYFKTTGENTYNLYRGYL